MSALIESLETLFREIVGHDGPVAPDTGPDQVAGWTSLNHINLVVEVEEELDVSFSAEEAAEIATFGALVELVEAKLNGSR